MKNFLDRLAINVVLGLILLTTIYSIVVLIKKHTKSPVKTGQGTAYERGSNYISPALHHESSK